MAKEIVFTFASDISKINSCSTCITYVNKILLWLGGVSVYIEGNKLVVRMRA